MEHKTEQKLKWKNKEKQKVKKIKQDLALTGQIAVPFINWSFVKPHILTRI